MSTADSLREQFDELGVEPSDDVIGKCRNLKISFRENLQCLHSSHTFFLLLSTLSGLDMFADYNLDDPVEFVEKWMAFSISNLNGAEPTVDLLNDFEIKEFKNKKPSNAKSMRNGSKPTESKRLKVYNQDSDDEENDLLGNYVCITPKVSHDKFKIKQYLGETLEESPSAICI